MLVRLAVSLVVGTIAMLAAVLPSAASGGDTLANVRDATTIYNDPAAALAGGYELLTDAADLACIEQPGDGGMGVHFVKGALIQSGVLDPARPQALVYQAGSDGRLRLGALEYVVFQSTWDANHSSPPSLFGKQFMLTPAGNRFGLPAFYSLHAWVWKHNPKGTFEMWNPDVHCQGARNTLADDSEPAVAEPMATGMDMP